jgi:hypothetical protein
MGSALKKQSAHKIILAYLNNEEMILYLNRMLCTRISMFALGYESLHLGMNLCTWVRDFPLRNKVLFAPVF